MNIKIFESNLTGTLDIPGSKSQTIRAIICAALANGKSYIKNISFCDDVKVAIDAVKTLGAKVEIFLDKNNNKYLEITGLKSKPNHKIKINCKESATVFRIFLSIVAVLGIETKFILEKSLIKRKFNYLTNELSKHGIIYKNNLSEGYLISKGQIILKDFVLPGHISSQYITSLLISLSLIKTNNKKKFLKIKLSSELKSSSYVEMTIDILKKFGIKIKKNNKKNNKEFIIFLNQEFKPTSIQIEKDYSIAANFLVAKCLNSKNLIIKNLPKNSLQGDKLILDIIKKINFKKFIKIDADSCIDIIPILVVLFCFKNIKSVIYNVSRLRLKESDRLTAICESLKKLGATIYYNNDKILINNQKKLLGNIFLNSYSDHRIAMALAIAAINCKHPVIISDAESVNKSFPEFWSTLKKHGCNLEFI
ncbi:MAG: 3-phosphoshikimate 1-carboxyvinyltransferase [Oscillospiraceae bacterium]|nr:3-phosphoshikimate 1-carboxyvinyltransferase [Oscillospiraceae bacterium]